MVNKVDSNLTGLRYAKEVRGTPKGLTGTDVWKELEPNSYSDFGGTTTLTPRKPIVANRQVRKGRTTDLDAKGGFELDFTSDNILDLAVGFFFADWRDQLEVDQPTAIAATDKSITKTGAFATGVKVGSIINLTGFANAGNNGLKTVATLASADEITTTETMVDETPAVGTIVKVVGFKSTAGDLDITVTSGVPTMSSTVLDFTTLGIIPGQWIYIGGDDTTQQFTTAGNNGFARVKSVAAHAIVFDKTQNTMVTEANTTKLVRLYFSDLIKNEDDPTLIIQQTFQFERSLSSAGFEYLEGAYANTLDINMKSADKITMALEFQALTHTPVEFGDRKAGTFPPIATDPTAYNTATDLVQLRVAEQGDASPLFAFVQTMTIKINNNVTPLKALGVLGAFDVNVGDFEVTGDITAYFSDISAVEAVRNADSLTINWLLALDNRGWMFDVPELTFDKGTLDVTKDQAITIPVGVNGAEDETLKTTLMANYFSYLPNAATP